MQGFLEFSKAVPKDTLKIWGKTFVGKNGHHEKSTLQAGNVHHFCEVYECVLYQSSVTASSEVVRRYWQ